MKKLTITISDKAHSELLREQFNRKMNKAPRTSLAEIAGDVLTVFLEAGANEKDKQPK